MKIESELMDYIEIGDPDNDLTFHIHPTAVEGSMKLILSSVNFILLESGFEPTEAEHMECFLGNVYVRSSLIDKQNLLSKFRQFITNAIYQHRQLIHSSFTPTAILFVGEFNYKNEKTLHPTPPNFYPQMSRSRIGA